MEKVFIDSSVFLSYILEDENSGWAKSVLADIYNNSKNNYKPFNSHEVLGEVLEAIFESFERKYYPEAIEQFRRYYDTRKYTLCTKKPANFQKELVNILKIDPRLEHTDSKVLTHASLECEVIYTTETSWSDRLPIEMINHRS